MKFCGIPRTIKTICYGRVSTHSQQDEQRQLEHLRTRYPEAEIISEVGSGLNFKRKKFLAILERIIDGDIQRIVVPHLKQAAQRKGVIVVLCNESYTSKTCGNCGHVHHRLGGNKVFKCPHCGIQISRDVNGARNILLRALQATAFTVTHDSIVLSEKSELTDAVVNLV